MVDWWWYTELVVSGIVVVLVAKQIYHRLSCKNSTVKKENNMVSSRRGDEEDSSYPRKWRLEKRIDLGNVLLLVSMLAVGYANFVRVDERVRVLETNQSKLTELVEKVADISKTNQILMSEREKIVEKIEEGIAKINDDHSRILGRVR